MSHFPYLPGRGSLANWGIGTSVAPSEFWWFESSIYKCLNEDGGTWALASTMYFTGTHGLHLSASTPCTLYGNTSIGYDPVNTLYVGGTTTFAAPVTCILDLTVDGDTTIGDSASDTATFNADTTVAAAASLYLESGAGDFTCAKTTTFTGDTTFGVADSAVAANRTPFTLLGDLALNYSPVGSNPGRIQFYTGAETLTGNRSLYVAEPSIVGMDPSGATRLVTLMHADAQDGDWKVIIHIGTANVLNIADQTAGALGVSLSAGGIAFCFYLATAGQWYAGTANSG